MSNFAQSIHEYQLGECSEAELLTRLDTTLTRNESPATELLNTLLAEHTQDPLADELFSTLVGTINEHLQRTTGSGAGNLVNDESPGDGTAVNPNPPSVAADSDHTEALVSSSDAVPLPKKGVGDVLNNRFELRSLLGQGGMSRVYLALDRRKQEARSRDPHVAVKILDVTGPNREAAFVALQREAQKSQELQHPNIVRVFDFDRDGDTVYLTMEHLDGQAVSQLIREQGKNGLPLERCLKLVEQMGQALAHAHREHIVHADFKPSNMTVTAKDRIKVIDFGIARAFRLPDETDAAQTAFDPRELGALTPAYASPEMFENLDPDPKDDIYSLGCVVYELLTGEHPFANIRAPEARAAGIKPKRPKDLTGTQWQALLGALAFDRNQRTASVDAFLNDFLPERGVEDSQRSKGRGWRVVAGLLSAVIVGYALWNYTSGPASHPDAFVDCSQCPTMVPIPAGSARIGSPVSEAGRRSFEGPRFTVIVAQPLAVSESEVTVEQFRKYVDSAKPDIESGCRTVESGWQVDSALSWRNPGFKQNNTHPVTCVSWQDAQSYVAWLSSVSNAEYRLPSEAEWEYAARAGTTRAHGWAATNEVCHHANVADASAMEQYPEFKTFACDDGYVHTAPVKRSRANTFGLFDTQGNLFEWTADCWHPTYQGADASGAPRLTGSCTERVLRGGSYHSAPSEQRLAYRNRFAADYRANTFGFRVVRTNPQGADNAN